MNRAYAGRLKIAWYCDGQSMTSNSIFSRLKFSRDPKTTSSAIFPKGTLGFPGTMPWKQVSEIARFVSERTRCRLEGGE